MDHPSRARRASPSGTCISIPDLATFAIVPWTEAGSATARLLCGVHRPDGEPFLGDPRAVLIRQLERARALGYTYVGRAGDRVLPAAAGWRAASARPKGTAAATSIPPVGMRRRCSAMSSG